MLAARLMSDAERTREGAILSQQQLLADRTLKCSDCFRDFVFTKNEQAFFAEKGLTNLPKRCLDCRVIIRAYRAGKLDAVAQVDCTACGAKCRVPFIPRGHKPVLCLPCRHNQDASSNSSEDSHERQSFARI